MKNVRLLALFVLTITFSCCKSSTQAIETATPSLLEVHTILDSAESKFIEYAAFTNGDPWKAIDLTAYWLKEQPTVATAYVFGNSNITIVLRSGLKTTFGFDEIDDNGYSRFRGGSKIDSDEASAAMSLLSLPISGNTLSSKNTITNKHVLIFGSEDGTLPGVTQQIPITTKLIQDAKLGLDVKVLIQRDASYEAINTFKNYGLVIIDTHGLPDAFLVGSPTVINYKALPEAELIAFLNKTYGPLTGEKLATGQLELTNMIRVNPKKIDWQKIITQEKSRKLMYTTKYLAEVPPMPNTVIMGNMCYSGWTSPTMTVKGRSIDLPNGKTGYLPDTMVAVDGIGTAFLKKNPISYYGYAGNTPIGESRPVEDGFAQTCENALVTRLMKGDSTEIAHLRTDNVTEYLMAPIAPTDIVQNLYFRHFGSNDYSYEGCVDSFTDERDGQKYKAVCIGKQNWMAQNLNYATAESITNVDDPAYAATYGRLYHWSDLMQGAASTNANPSGIKGICPKGWHIPSQSEFDQLINFLGGQAVAGAAMKTLAGWDAPNINATNSSGFSALPGGDCITLSNGENTFQMLGTAAWFWSATLSQPPFAQVYQLTNENAFVTEPGAKDNFGMSCRCLKD